MCLSRVGQVIYGAGCVLAIGLILTGSMTPGWQTVKLPNSTEEISTGLFKFACSFPDDNKSNDSRQKSLEEFCEEWWKNQPTWEKIVIGGLVLALLILAGSVIFNIVTCFCVCGREYFLQAQAMFALAAFFSLVVSITLFAVKHKDEISRNVDDYNKNGASYSFYLTCAAAMVTGICAAVASVSAWLSKQCCCM